MISAGDVTIGDKTITHDELLTQGQKTADQMCGGYMGKFITPNIPPDPACVQTVMSTYNTATASMTDRQIMVYNDAFRLMAMQRFNTCFNRQAPTALKNYKKGNVETFNACTIGYVNDPTQVLSFGNEQADLNYAAWMGYGEARARGMVEIQSAEDLAIPSNLQGLINKVKQDPKLSQPEKDAVVADLERMFRQAMGQVPRADRIKASVPVGQSVVDKATPQVDQILNEGSAPAMKDKAKRSLYYTLPGSVDANNNAAPVVWRTAPDAVTGLLPPNATPEMAAELRRLYGQALSIYAGKGGTDDAALANALKAAVEKVPADKRAEAIANWEVKDVPIDGSKKPTDVILGPNTAAPASLSDDNAGMHEFERRRAIEALWARAVLLLGDRPLTNDMRNKMAASIKPQLKDKHTYEIYKMTPTEVKPDGSVVVSQVPLQTLINGLVSDEALRHAPNDMSATEMGGLNKIVTLYNKARLLRAQDSRPNIKNMTDAQLAQRVNAFAGPILRKTANNPTPDTHIFTGDGTDITGFNDDGSIVGTIHDPAAGSDPSATGLPGLYGGLDGWGGVGYGSNKAWFLAAFLGADLAYRLNSNWGVGVYTKIGGIWQNPLFPDDNSQFNIMQENGGYGGLALRALNLHLDYTNKNGANVADKLVIGGGLVNARFADEIERKMPGLTYGTFQGMIPGIGATSTGGALTYTHSMLHGRAPFAEANAKPDSGLDLTLSGNIGQPTKIALVNQNGQRIVADNRDFRTGVMARLDWNAGVTSQLPVGLRLSLMGAYTYASGDMGGNLLMISPNVNVQPKSWLDMNLAFSYGRLSGPEFKDGALQSIKVGGDIGFPFKGAGISWRPSLMYLFLDNSWKRRIAADQTNNTQPGCEDLYDCGSTDGQQSTDPTSNAGLSPFAKMGNTSHVVGLNVNIDFNDYFGVQPTFQLSFPKDQYGESRDMSVFGGINIYGKYYK